MNFLQQLRGSLALKTDIKWWHNYVGEYWMVMDGDDDSFIIGDDG